MQEDSRSLTCLRMCHSLMQPTRPPVAPLASRRSRAAALCPDEDEDAPEEAEEDAASSDYSSTEGSIADLGACFVR